MQKSSVNKVILIGHLGSKPEGRYTASGTSTATFSIATNESWIDSDKIKQEHTEWHSIIAWNKLADFAIEYLQKGQLIYLEGKLQTRTYRDKNDVQHWKTEIISNIITPLDWKNPIKTQNKKSNRLEKRPSTDHDDDESMPF
tara:strand:- start:99 stop:524 length:426 start_codon:yes stop_codon:yes gene_type:complete